MRVAVVGAGIAGLVAAHRLEQRARAAGLPIDLAVLEAEPRAGGHACTIREDGFLVEAGPNGWLARPREPHLLELARELGLDSRLIEANPAAKKRFVKLDGRLERAPDGPPTLLQTGALSPLGKLRLMLEPWARPAADGVEETVFEFAERRIGREAAERLVDAAISGISAGDSKRLSVRAAFPLMIEMEREHGSLIRAMMARQREGATRLLSFDGGLAVLVDALRARLDAVIHTGKAARGVARRNGAWRIEREDGPIVEAEELVLALPAPRAATLVSAENPELAATLSTIPFAKVAMVALAYREADVPRPLDGYGYLVARSEGSDVLGVVWESSLFVGRAPVGHVLLRVMMGGARRPDTASRGEPELIATARSEIAGTLGITTAPERTWVRRWPEAIAQYERGHLERVAAARAQAARSGGLDLCGSSYDGASFGGAALSGERSAERVMAAIEVRRGATMPLGVAS
jgi:oxygen-dependent protoporphyrinogen oxidase